MAGQQAQITKEEAIMKGACSLLAAGTLLCLLTNTALADDNSISSEARQNHSLLSIWDKPAFSPAPSMGQVPWLDSRPEKGERVDFLLRPTCRTLAHFRSEGQLAGEFRGRASSSELTRLPHAAATR
jgi:hypothetical protein